MVEEITIPKSGTPATYKLGKIKGEIAAVTVRYDTLEFEFIYFSHGEFKKIGIADNNFKKSNYPYRYH